MLMRKNTKLTLSTLALASVVAAQASAATQSKRVQAKTPQTPLSTQTPQKQNAATGSTATPSSPTTSAAPASGAAVTGTSTATTKSTLDTVKEYVNVQFSNEISGPTVEKPDGNLLKSTNKLTVAYRTGKWRLGPVFQFASTVAGSKLSEHFDVKDPYLRAANVSLFNTGNLNLFADLRYYVPATEVSQKNDSLGSLRTTQVLSYSVPNSRVSALVIGIARIWGFNGTYVADGTDYLALTMMPGLAYQLTPSISLAGYYGGTGAVKESSGGKDAAWAYEDFIDLGVEFSIGNFLTINPYVEITPSAGVTAANTTYQATLNWNLL